MIHQRELGEDTRSFANALKAALREDPDVIWWKRDLETIQLAITAAETGHLVFGTLHTDSAAQTWIRWMCPRATNPDPRAARQPGGVFAQTSAGGSIHPGAFGRDGPEIMADTPALANLIREGKTAQIYSQLQTGGQYGMQTLGRCPGQPGGRRPSGAGRSLSKASKPDELMRLVSEP